MDLDTYYDTHPNNPSNQPELKSVISYEVVVDDNVEVIECETLGEAYKVFASIVFGTTHDWVELTIWKVTDGQRECIKSALSSTLFLEMKRNLARIREIESFPMDATSDEQQELVELKRKLYGNC